MWRLLLIWMSSKLSLTLLFGNDARHFVQIVDKMFDANSEPALPANLIWISSKLLFVRGEVIEDHLHAMSHSSAYCSIKMPVPLRVLERGSFCSIFNIYKDLIYHIATIAKDVLLTYHWRFSTFPLVQQVNPCGLKWTWENLIIDSFLSSVSINL